MNCCVASPVVVNPKSCAESGWASLMITIVARLVLVNVQVTVSSSSRSIEPVSGLAGRCRRTRPAVGVGAGDVGAVERWRRVGLDDAVAALLRHEHVVVGRRLGAAGRGELEARRRRPRCRSKSNVPSPPAVFLTTTIVPRSALFVIVQVIGETTSVALTATVASVSVSRPLQPTVPAEQPMESTS